MSFFSFDIVHSSKKTRARVGRITTPHGVIDTPHFVGVGTHAALKAVDMNTVNNIGLQLMFCNTYHLMIQPGTAIIKKAGGLHKFMNRSLPIITDSGGFQVFSLAYGTVNKELKSSGKKQQNNSVMKISEEGVLFRSYRDGKKILLTPEISIAAQKDLGADIIIPFDELPPYHVDERSLIKSLHRTHRWEERSLQEHKKNVQKQAMYGVIHGGTSERLRKLSCSVLTKMDFDGFAIGGSFGKTREQMFDMLAFTMPFLPIEKPNHLLGIGDLLSVDQCVKAGIDTFDSSHPTRCARHGLLFSRKGDVKILHSSHKEQFIPVDEECLCFTCQHYTRSYIHHLFKAHELTGYSLASIHNVQFMVDLMARYRESILTGDV